METLLLLLSVPTTIATTETTEATLTDLEMTLIDLETVVEITEALTTTTAEATMVPTIRKDNVILNVTAVSTQDQAQTSLLVPATTPALTMAPTTTLDPTFPMEETRAL